MSLYTRPLRQLLVEVFWASARGFEGKGEPETAAQMRESARLLRHGYHVDPAGGTPGAVRRRRRLR